MGKGVVIGLAAACALVGAALALGGSRQHVALPEPPAYPDTLTMVGRPAAHPAQSARTAAWCGTASTTDRPNAVAGYPVHVVYVYPADGSDQSATVAPKIEG